MGYMKNVGWKVTCATEGGGGGGFVNFNGEDDSKGNA